MKGVDSSSIFPIDSSMEAEKPYEQETSVPIMSRPEAKMSTPVRNQMTPQPAHHKAGNVITLKTIQKNATNTSTLMRPMKSNNTASERNISKLSSQGYSNQPKFYKGPRKFKPQSVDTYGRKLRLSTIAATEKKMR